MSVKLSPPVVPVIRRNREMKTIEVMIGMYCRRHHRRKGDAPCATCSVLFEYAARRLERCVFGDAKPTCANCLVHCYSAEKREQIRIVMKWAGPRMLFHHPLRAIFHLLDGRRAAPSLPTRTAKCAAQAERAEGPHGHPSSDC